MNNTLNAFGIAVRTEREKQGLTQVQLANKLSMSKRTIVQVESARSNPKFETIVLLMQALDISLDALVFPETAAHNSVPKCVHDFFAYKGESISQRFINLCRDAEALKNND